MRTKVAAKLAAVILTAVMTAGPLAGIVAPGKATAATAPNLLITEVVPASGGSGQAYEYVEIYNNTSQAIDLNNYELRYYTTSPYTTYANHWAIGSKTIEPRTSLVLWLQKFDNLSNAAGPNALSDFNANYGTALTQDQVFDVALQTSGQGLHDSSKRRIGITDAAGNLLVSAYINDGVKDGITDKSVTYQYSGSGIEMTKIANGQTATPGLLADGQIPGPKAPTGLASQAGDRRAALTWDANGESAIAGYKVYQEGASQPATVTGTTYTSTGLVNYTPYRFRVTAVDANGDESQGSAPITVIPTDVVDTTPPAAPTGVAAGLPALGQVAVSWAGNTESDVAGYRVYANDNEVASVSSATYQALLTSLLPGKAYRIQVSAYDRAGNESVKSAPVRAVPTMLPPANQLYITELVQNTDNHYLGYDAFEYVELYNSSSDPIDLNGYTLKLESSDPAKTWQQTINGPAVIAPHDTFLFWTRVSGLEAMSKSDFNEYYYTAYKEKYVPEDHLYIMNGVSGLINTSRQTVIVQDASGQELTRAVYNDSGNEVGTNTSTTYGYPIDGSNVMRKIAGSAAPTPGQLVSDQLPALPGADLQPPAVPTGVQAVPGNGEVTVSWNPVADADLAAYQIYRDGTLERTVPASTTHAAVSLLIGRVNYSFTVASVDSSGNVSAPSAAAAATPDYVAITQTDRSVAIDKAVYDPTFWSLSKPGPVVPGLAEGVVPQSMAYYPQKDWILISNYREDGSPSTLSVVDASTQQLVKSVNLYQEDNTPYMGHAGGVAVSADNVWLASGEYMYRIPLDAIVQARDKDNVQFADRFRTTTRASMGTYHDGVLWVGDFYESPGYLTDPSHHMENRDGEYYDAWLVGYKLDAGTDRLAPNREVVDGNKVVPDYILSIPGDIQGVDVMDNEIVLSQSFSRAKESNLLRYVNPLAQDPHETVTMGQQTVPVWFLDSKSQSAGNAVLAAPPMTEGLMDRQGRLYVLFESGANAYRSTALNPIDRLQMVDLNAWRNLGLEDTSSDDSDSENGNESNSTSNPGGTGIQSSAQEDAGLQVKVGDLPTTEQGAAQIVLPADKQSVTVQGSAEDMLKHGGLEVAKGSVSLTLNKDALQSVLQQLGIDASQSIGITMALTPADASGTERLLQQENAAPGAQLALAGDVFDFTLTVATQDGQQRKVASFEHPITVQFQVSPTADKTLVGVYYIRDDGRVEYVGGTWKDGKLEAELTHFSKYAVLEFDKRYADVPDDFWAAQVIRELSAKHVVQGTDDTHFAPNGTITRAEYAALLARGLGLKASGKAAFADVPASAWYADAVAAAAEAGIVDGIDAERFAPDGFVTREQIAAMTVRALKYRAGNAGAGESAERAAFSDEGAIDAWAVPAVDAAVRSGVMQGKEMNRFDPLGAATRAESAQTIFNVLQHLGAK